MDEENENLGGTISEIADGLIEKAPGVSEHVIDAEREKQQATEPAPADEKEKFDPLIHLADEKGQPVLTKAGAFRKKSGRKAGTGESVSRPAIKSQLGIGEISSKTDDIAAAPAPDGCAVAGIAAAHLLFQIGIQVGGEEWNPIKNRELGLDEAANMERAFTDYFRVKGVTDFPPGVALTLAVVGYIGPRLIMPKTKSRLEKAADWVKGKFFGKKKAIESEKP